MNTEPQYEIGASEALTLLFTRTWGYAYDYLNEIHDKDARKEAWRCFLKVNYLMNYAVLARTQKLNKPHVLEDAYRLNVRITQDRSLYTEVVAAVTTDGKTIEPLDSNQAPIPMGEQDLILDDLFLQALHMENLVLFHKGTLPEKVVRLRIMQVKKIFDSSSPEVQERHAGQCRFMLILADQVIRILRGEEEPAIDYDSLIMSGKEDVHTDRMLVDSPAWNWWVDVLQFMAGQRKGQENYDPEREDELKAFRWLVPYPFVIEYDPQDVVKNPRPPMVVPGKDVQAVAARLTARRKGQKVAVFAQEDDWFFKFRSLEWGEDPDDETVDRYLREMGEEPLS